MSFDYPGFVARLSVVYELVQMGHAALKHRDGKTAATIDPSQAVCDLCIMLGYPLSPENLKNRMVKAGEYDTPAGVIRKIRLRK